MKKKLYKIVTPSKDLGYYVGYNKADALETAKMYNKEVTDKMTVICAGFASISQQTY